MRTEVEIKAWVDDPEGLRRRVAERYAHGGSYTKEDVYYRLPASGGSGGVAAEFRLRTEGGRSLVTAKRKSISGGIEVNEEMEFAVSDAAEFERFAAYLGAAVFARKRKRGERYGAGETTIELSRVERLGDFIEIERLVDDAAPEKIREARESVRALLEELSIPAERIEPRYYIDLLAELEG